MLNHPPLLESVPRHALDLWASVCAHALRNVHRSLHAQPRNPDKIDDSVLDLLALPSLALQRSDSSISTTLEHLRQHFNAVDAPLRLPAQDREPRPPQIIDADTRTVRRAARLAQDAMLSRAVRALLPSSVADASRPEVMDRIQHLHPQRHHPLPESPPQGPDNPNLVVFPDGDALKAFINKNINVTASPGPSGWSALMLRPILKEPEALKNLGSLLTEMAQGTLPARSTQLLLASTLIPMEPKPGKIRPVAVPELLYKVATAFVISLVKPQLATILAPHQFGICVPGGATTAVRLIDCILQTPHPQAAAITVDIKNAFNSRHRRDLLGALYECPDLAQLYRISNWAYSTESDLYIKDKTGKIFRTIKSSDGVRQGDALAALLFALSIRSSLSAAAAARPSVRVVAVMDDITILGPPDDVVVAYRVLNDKLSQEGLEIVQHKSAALWMHQDPVPNILRAADLPVLIGHVDLLGVPIGSDIPMVHQALEAQVASHDRLFTLLCHPSMPPQIAALLLRLCAVPRLQYILASLPPRLTSSAAALFDSNVLRAASTIHGLPHPVPDPASTQLCLPVRHGGLGIPRMVDVAPIAFYSSVVAAAPSLHQALSVHPAAATPDHPLLADLKSSIDQIAARSPETKRLLLHPSPPTLSTLQTAVQQQLPPAAHIHRNISAILAHEAHRSLLQRLQPPDAARLRSASGPLASAWLTVIPRDRDRSLVLSQMSFQDASRIRLGLLPPLRPPVPGAVPFCRCGINLRDRPDHALGCRQYYHPHVERHNVAVKRVARWTQQAGASVVVSEPHGLSPESQARPDILIHHGHQSFLVDVTVRHPGADTYLPRAAREPLVAASAGEQEKQAKYADLARQRQATLIPFAVETFGAFGRSAQAFIRHVSTWAAESESLYSPTEVSIYLTSAVSVAVQAGNSRSLQACSRRIAWQHPDGRFYMPHVY